MKNVPVFWQVPNFKGSMDFVFVLVWFHLFVVPMFYMQTVVIIMFKHLKLTQIQKINRDFYKVTGWMRYHSNESLVGGGYLCVLWYLAVYLPRDYR